MCENKNVSDVAILTMADFAGGEAEDALRGNCYDIVENRMKGPKVLATNPKDPPTIERIYRPQI